MVFNDKTKRACDSCHNVKEKCRKPDDERPCERCSRLKLDCHAKRRVTKTGRKSRLVRRLSYTLPNASVANSPIDLESPRSDHKFEQPLYNHGFGSNPTILPMLDSWERHFVNLMKDIDGPSPLDKFLVGPSFYQSHHVSFLQTIMEPTSALKDAAVACAAVLFGDHGAEYSTSSTEIAYQRAARALSSLRSYEIISEQNLSTVLILGMALTTFAMHVTQGRPSLISHYILRLVEPRYQTLLPPSSVMMDFLMCLICTETFECLLSSDIPAMRVNTSGRNEVVDRYVGVSYSIFPLFFDICYLGNFIRQRLDNKSPEILQCLEEMNSSIEQWQPSPPTDLIHRFTQTEVLGILAQARILRFLGILALYRMQNPYGTNDHAACRLSQAIIAEFDMLIKLTGRSVPCTALAYLAACFEIMDVQSRDEAITKLPVIITFSRQSQINFRTRLIAIWNARDLNHSFHWFDLGRYLGEPK